VTVPGIDLANFTATTCATPAPFKIGTLPIQTGSPFAEEATVLRRLTKAWAVTGPAFLMLALTFAPSHAGSIMTESCVGNWVSGTCVTTFGKRNPTPHIFRVPESISEQDRAEQIRRDQLWLARCKPVISQDRFGVPRYIYAADGCEFGRLN
jgi:hypothetical protein